MSTPIPPARPPQAQSQRPARMLAPTPTHLIACSRPAKFRRSDLQFTSDWQSWSLEELKALWGAEADAKLAAILREPMIMAQLCTAEEAAEKAAPAKTVQTFEDENAQLRTALAEVQARLAVLEAPKG